MLGEITSGGAAPALEAVMRFTSQRQRLLAHNIANISTPGFLSQDVSPVAFQAQLRDAVERRRTRDPLGPLVLKDTSEVKQISSDRLELTPHTPSGNILAHDRNNRDLERSMQDLVENATAFRIAADLWKSRSMMLTAAISERP